VKLAVTLLLLLHRGTIIALNATISFLQVLRDNSMLIVDDRIQKLYSSSTNLSMRCDTQIINIINRIISSGFVDTNSYGWQITFKILGSNTNLAKYFIRFGDYVTIGKLEADNVYIGQLAGLLETLILG
jgi:cytosine/adenosine deaminase-related metal-dependent hydrolase